MTTETRYGYTCGTVTPEGGSACGLLHRTEAAARSCDLAPDAEPTPAALVYHDRPGGGSARLLTARPESATERRNCAYRDGRRDALRLKYTTGAVCARLRRDTDYWRGWHDARPEYARKHSTTAEDPTRGGGWCVDPAFFEVDDDSDPVEAAQ